jgi:hypothetical protein
MAERHPKANRETALKIGFRSFRSFRFGDN